jgi:hypothetical protein
MNTITIPITLDAGPALEQIAAISAALQNAMDPAPPADPTVLPEPPSNAELSEQLWKLQEDSKRYGLSIYKASQELGRRRCVHDGLGYLLPAKLNIELAAAFELPADQRRELAESIDAVRAAMTRLAASLPKLECPEIH